MLEKAHSYSSFDEAMFSDSREVARALRDVLAQHRDVFSVIDASETRQQILA
jgi:hypothetical protein